MKTKNRIKFLLGITCFLTIALNLNSSVFAIEDEVALRVLGGLRKVFLNVAPINPKIVERGLTSERLKADIEQQLQDAGIEMVDEEEFGRLRRSQNYPLCRLELFTQIFEIKDKDVIIFNIYLQVQQAAFLARNPGIKINAPTWQKGELSYSYGTSVDSIPKSVRNLVDQFIKAYLAANKK